MGANCCRFCEDVMLYDGGNISLQVYIDEIVDEEESDDGSTNKAVVGI